MLTWIIHQIQHSDANTVFNPVPAREKRRLLQLANEMNKVTGNRNRDGHSYSPAKLENY
jgi:tmRNA-binding protein